MQYVGKYDSRTERWKTWIQCQTQENMIVMPSAGNHEAYAKRGKINPMPQVGKYDSSAKRWKIWVLREARENECDAKRGKLIQTRKRGQTAETTFK